LPDPRADLYALGCVSYFLLTGRDVFEAGSAMDMLRSHLGATPAPPSQRAPVPVPEELDRVVLQCLEKDPDRRPASALELREMLRAVPVESAWSDERAAKWWADHAPALGRFVPEAATLPGATPKI
jgi:serine/threonine-protein kinase